VRRLSLLIDFPANSDGEVVVVLPCPHESANNGVSSGSEEQGIILGYTSARGIKQFVIFVSSPVKWSYSRLSGTQSHQLEILLLIKSLSHVFLFEDFSVCQNCYRNIFHLSQKRIVDLDIPEAAYYREMKRCISNDSYRDDLRDLI
jgi:hypothetical protein